MDSMTVAEALSLTAEEWAAYMDTRRDAAATQGAIAAQQDRISIALGKRI